MTCKGARRAKVPLARAAAAAIDTYLADRVERGGLAGPTELTDLLLATATGGRLRQANLWKLVRRLAQARRDRDLGRALLHSLRHSAISLALPDTPVSLT